MEELKVKERRFESTYRFAGIIEESIKSKIEFWNYNEMSFILRTVNFSRDTLLHLYIETRLFNFYREDTRDNGEDYDFDEFLQLFTVYSIKFTNAKNETEMEGGVFFQNNIKSFMKLFELVADEVFHVLFSNRKLLLEFNELARVSVKDYIDKNKYSLYYLSKKGTLKRAVIPKWVKDAVFLRDNGRCVFCLKDLTGIVNIPKSNYDHIVPLDLFGVNDPCNIQLTCERCNKQKTNKPGVTALNYQSWWTS